MRTWTVFAAIFVTAIVGVSVIANEEPTEEYVNAMKILEIVASELPQVVESGDHEALFDLIVQARPAVLVNEEYWMSKDVEDAIKWSKTLTKSISEVSVAQYLMSLSTNPVAQDGAAISVANFVKTCDSCHAVHREQLPDGTYRIK